MMGAPDGAGRGGRWQKGSHCRDFLDSTGLSLLVTTHHRLLQAGGGLRVEGAAGQGRGILDMAGATGFLDQG